MSRVLSLPTQLRGIIIEGCWQCPFFDGSSVQEAHCNCLSHYGIENENPTLLEDGVEPGCPLQIATEEDLKNARARWDSVE